MSKLLSVLAIFALLLSRPVSDEQVVNMSIEPPVNTITEADGSNIVLTFDANSTTGFQWSAFILYGDAVRIDETAGGYVSDPAPGNMTGVGGKHSFVLYARNPGECIIRFTYKRAWEEVAAREEIYAFYVSEDGQIRAEEITEFAVLEGTVIRIDREEGSVTLENALLGEVNVNFYDAVALPVLHENIRVYTNGTMTRSLPPVVNAVYWETMPAEEARMAEFAPILLQDGCYYDVFSQRAYAVVTTSDSDTCSIEIHWADSAFEDYVWNMTGRMNAEGLLQYDDCILKRVITREDGSV